MTRLRAADRASLAVGAIAFSGTLLVAYFDLRTQLPFLDEYARRWTVSNLVAGRGFHFLGRAADLVQTFAAAVPAAAGVPPGFWRWSELPFLAAQAILAGLVSRQLGAVHFWSVVAGAAVACCPITLWLATGMMTETVFVALFLAATLFSIRWVQGGTAMPLAVLMAFLATAQRQQGAGIAVAVTAALLAGGHRRPVNRRDIGGLICLWAACAVAVAVPEILGSGALLRSTGGRASLAAGAAGVVGPTAGRLYGPAFWLYAVASLVPLLGFALLPMSIPILAGRRSVRRWFPGFAAACLASLGVTFALIISLPVRNTVFAGNILNPTGLGPPFLDGKPSLIPGWGFVALGLASCVIAFAALAWRQDWRWRSLPNGQRFVVLNVAVQFAFIFYQGQVFDRYYMVMLACIVPLVAATIAVGPSHSLEKVVAVTLLAAGVVYYAAAEQDYQAWQTARDAAARLAYASAPPWEVAAGWEAEAEYVWLPAIDDPTHQRPGVVVDHPKLKLIFAPPGDPRPGVDYRSLAPGRLVVVPAGEGPIHH